jgi:hypothetical protein
MRHERKTNNPYEYHGLDLKSPEYRAWGGLRRWAKASGREFHAAWNSFPKFLSMVGKRPSAHHELRLVDRNEGYVPNNVKWTIHRAAFR